MRKATYLNITKGLMLFSSKNAIKLNKPQKIQSLRQRYFSSFKKKYK